ncbi:Uncharacterised protein [Serratia fonticola]|uniref:Uncharacterized protein n=1 Tax=Serratia fonticola TaxID=47917 RepID=A0A4U9TCW2_SERFO|nr:Uncharacterised protein [Serratia fonticola]
MAPPEGSEGDALDVFAAQGRQGGAGGIPLGQDCAFRFCQYGTTDFLAIATGDIHQDQGGLQWRQARVERGIFCIAASVNLAVFGFQRYAAMGSAVRGMAAVAASRAAFASSSSSVSWKP